MASSFSSADYTPEEYERLVQIRTRKMQLLNEIQVLQEELVKTNECLESVNANSTEQSASKSRDRAMAIKKFNESPKKGLKALVDAGLVENSAGDIAKFFILSDELKKSAIGDFLGEKEDFHLEVLQHFVRLQNFRGLAPVQAMRNFLLLFRLPGEAQKIDRIIEHFASQYCQQNPGLFDHPDTCYTLCYATIMLNTSLYNPSVKERMSLEDFMHITDSLNVSRQLVTEIFNSIKSESFKFPDDEVGNGIHSLNLNTAVFKLADKQGWLQKQGSRYRTWNRRWFVLSSRCLYYFEFPSNREPNGIIPLEGLRVRVLGCQELDSSKRPHTFELYSPNSDVIKTCKKKPTDAESRTPQQQQQLAVVGQHSAYRMAAPSREEMHAWISAIQRSLNKESGLEEVLERRQRAASGGTGLALGREQRA